MMHEDRSSDTGRQGPPASEGGSTGEGSDTALEALIRKRKLQTGAGSAESNLPPQPQQPTDS